MGHRLSVDVAAKAFLPGSDSLAHRQVLVQHLPGKKRVALATYEITVPGWTH